MNPYLRFIAWYTGVSKPEKKPVLDKAITDYRQAITLYLFYVEESKKENPNRALLDSYILDCLFLDITLQTIHNKEDNEVIHSLESNNPVLKFSIQNTFRM